MARLGVLTSEFERPSLEAALDAVAAHHIGAVQFQLGSAVPSVPLPTSLQRGLDVLGEHLSPSLGREIREQLEKRNLALAAGEHGAIGESRRRPHVGCDRGRQCQQ